MHLASAIVVELDIANRLGKALRVLEQYRSAAWPRIYIYIYIFLKQLLSVVHVGLLSFCHCRRRWLVVPHG